MSNRNKIIYFGLLNVLIFAVYILQIQRDRGGYSEPSTVKITGIVEKAVWSGRIDAFDPFYRQRVAMNGDWYYLGSKEEVILSTGDEIAIYIPHDYTIGGRERSLISFEVIHKKSCVAKLTTHDGKTINVNCD
jgi:hypothetical protein